MKIGVIILARANYGRWPDKLLFKLDGKTILEQTIIKCKKLHVDTVIVSTTDSQEDQIIRDIAWAQGVSVSRGEPDDRTARYYRAIVEHNLDYFANVSAASPFFDVEYQNKLIDAMKLNPGYGGYASGGDCGDWVAHIFDSTLTIERMKNKDRDEEICVNPGKDWKTFRLYHWYDTEIKNRYLFDAHIAYKIQADNHRRICEYLGHFPENYNEVIKALMEIEL